MAACRPPSARKAARRLRAAPEPSGRSPPRRRQGERAGPRPPPARSVRSRCHPPCPQRRRPRSAPDCAPEGLRVSVRARLPGSSRAPPPAFAFAAAAAAAEARRGLPGQRPRPPKGRGGETGLRGEVEPQPGGAPRPGGNRWHGPGRALCVGALGPGAGGRASLGRSLPSPAPPGGRTPGRPGNGAGVTRNVPLGTLWPAGGEGWRRGPAKCGGCPAAAGWRGMLPARRAPPGRGLHSSAASLEVGSWVGVCAEKGEAGRPVTSGAGSYLCTAPHFWRRRLGVRLWGSHACTGGTGWGRPWF